MTDEQKQKCHAIIHSAATGSGLGNLVPVPGVGLAVDITAITSMTLALGSIFKINMVESTAKSVALTAFKRQVLKQPLKYAAKELSKLIPFAGSALSGVASVALIEAAGWAIASDFDREKSNI